jgi:hypothetical protein
MQVRGGERRVGGQDSLANNQRECSVINTREVVAMVVSSEVALVDVIVHRHLPGVPVGDVGDSLVVGCQRCRAIFAVVMASPFHRYLGGSSPLYCGDAALETAV